MKKNSGIIINIIIILIAIAEIVLYLVQGAKDTIDLIMFISSCVLIVVCTIEIFVQIKKNKQKDTKNSQDE